MALYTQVNTHFHPPEEAIATTLRACVLATNSSSIINWRGSKSGSNHAHEILPKQLRLTLVKPLERAAMLLEKVKSFSGDINMMRKVQALKWDLLTAPTTQRPAIMPLCHLVDQHTFRGVAHAMDATLVSGDFEKAFTKLFHSCTGKVVFLYIYIYPKREDWLHW